MPACSRKEAFGDSRRKEIIMRKQNRIPSALKHGIYSGIGLLPTEDPAEFQRFKDQIYKDFGPVGRAQDSAVEYIAGLMWRRDNLFTYLLAERARSRRSAIHAELDPSLSMPLPPFPLLLPPDTPIPEPPSPEERAARRKAADKQARTELGAAMELVEIGEVATFEYLEKELVFRERLDAMIARAIKSYLYLKGVCSMSLTPAAAPSQPLVSKAA
jgi:hypothetical protein